MSTFVADLTKVNDWEAFQGAMGEYHDSLESHFTELAQSLGVSHGCAMDVWYLRQRSRWTPELEKKLIALHKQGNPPNINEFGHSRPCAHGAKAV